ncbi:MAG: nucleoside 2-deoxyribosyltransferase, partial [Chloroflexota bacterium]
MKIYFSCSITGGRTDQPMYSAMVDWMLARGHNVLTAHIARPEVMAAEAIVDAVAVFQRDMKWIDEADVVVAEVSTPSHGVGYEIAYAVTKNKPVLCLAREGVKVSKMITGNDRVRFERYRDENDAIKM